MLAQLKMASTFMVLMVPEIMPLLGYVLGMLLGTIAVSQCNAGNIVIKDLICCQGGWLGKRKRILLWCIN